MNERFWMEGEEFAHGQRDWVEDSRWLTDAEVLTVLLPDVDWEALRESLAMYARFGPKRTPVADLASMWATVRRLLAVYDGKDG